jgi:hypothetical protein
MISKKEGDAHAQDPAAGVREAVYEFEEAGTVAQDPAETPCVFENNHVEHVRPGYSQDVQQ